LASENDQSSIEQKFSESWDEIEQFYTTFFDLPDWQYLKPIAGLISDLRSRGYDKQFRAGQALTWFVLSRSQEWGLRSEQPFLRIDLHWEGGMTVLYYAPPNPIIEVNLEAVELTPEWEHLLLRLLSHPID
jgi:hypothetical protein